ncbi:MAG TPA: LysM domain-containing protein, partial [Chloroflexota bacterium]
MRRSPLDDFDVRVSVEKLETPSLWGNLQSSMSTAAGRWSAADLSGYLQRRATIHVCVLALATAIVAGSAFVSRAYDDSAAFVPATAGTDSLEISARTAIIARSIPFTSPSGDSSYLVQPGDTLTSISRQTSVNEEALLAFNGYSSSDALNVGLRLRIQD